MKLGFTHATTKDTGREPYDPGDLLRLYIYGYLNKTRSSRQLETATHRNIELFWLLRQLRPDFKTIGDFRKDNTKAIKQVCREFTLLCKKLDLFGGELIAIDGSKFSAVNHNGRAYTENKIALILKAIDEKIDAEAIQTIVQRYGCESESAAMRLALRVLAASPMLAIQAPPRPTHARRSPKEFATADKAEQ